MPRNKIDFDTVRKIGLELAHVEESTAYRSPALKVRGRLIACLAVHKSAEPGTLAVCVDFADRDELIEAAPNIYYLTDHYVNYPVVLVRLSRIQRDALRDLIGMAWRFVATKGPAGRRKVREKKIPSGSK